MQNQSSASKCATGAKARQIGGMKREAEAPLFHSDSQSDAARLKTVP
jgi:hypothetical protein